MKILIPKFSEYQHYGKRMAPWIKLHKKLLDDHKFWSLKAEQQILLIALWLLASENPLEEEGGVVRMTRQELHWRLRDLNLKGLDALKSQGFIIITETEEGASKGATPHASKALARRYPQRETEGETEESGLRPQPPVAVGGPRPIEQQTDQQAVVTVWVEVCGEGSLGTPTTGKSGQVTYRGGMSPKRIAQSLVPLIKKHGRGEVLHYWRTYLQGRKAEFAKPEDFASKYLKWARGESGADQSIEDHNRAQAARFLDGEKRLTSERGLARVQPPGKT
jgi:hypothetical protein